jgi:hypothetical protein
MRKLANHRLLEAGDVRFPGLAVDRTRPWAKPGSVPGLSCSVLRCRVLRARLVHPMIACALASSAAAGCVDSSLSERDESGSKAIEARVTVDFSKTRVRVPPLAYGMHASVYDNSLHEPALSGELMEGGLGLLRWPGGGYSDNYHWSTHKMTPFRGDPKDVGYLAEGSDFGSFVSVFEGFGGTAMITVNYGSDLAGDGPGEPLEAAAWVAYANGDPEDEHRLGVDGSGTDWETVGAWASLRASLPLDEDDGRNLLRIAHPEPLGIEYWEIGNEVFGNGYYGESYQYEHDGHVPYDGTRREGNPLLSGAAYGSGVVAYAKAMRAVDPDIKIGAVLNTPRRDYVWGPTWNSDVLSECATVIDFVSVHWYPSKQASEIVALPSTEIETMTEELRAGFARYGRDEEDPIEIAMTELGGAPGHTLLQDAPQSLALFSADTYITAIEHGFVNLDWLELHNGTYLVDRRWGGGRGPAYHGIRLASLLAGPGDKLVDASSNRESIIAHASRRADGTYGVLLIDRQLPTALPAQVTLELSGAELAAPCERFVLSTEDAAEPGVFEGPEEVETLESPATLEISGYSITLVRCGSTAAE